MSQSDSEGNKILKALRVDVENLVPIPTQISAMPMGITSVFSLVDNRVRILRKRETISTIDPVRSKSEGFFPPLH